MERVGSRVTKFKKGDRVWASMFLEYISICVSRLLFNTRSGTYYRDIRAACFQELVVVPHHTVSLVPPNLSFESAACLGVPGLTAAMTLWKWLRIDLPPPTAQILKNGDYIVIWGGSTVTGQFLIQLANHCGLTVIAVTSKKTEGLVRSLGAEHVIVRNHRTNEEIAALARDIGGDQITRAVDLVGAETAYAALSTLSRSRPSILAPLSKGIHHDGKLVNVEIADVQMKCFILDSSSEVYATRLNDLVASGSIKVPQLEVLSGGLEDVIRGLELLKRGDRGGRKLVVSIS